MKFCITFKSPDCVSDCLGDEADNHANSIDGLTDGEREMIRENRLIELREAIKPWIEWEEYITVEIDTDAGTCTVLPADE